MSSVEGRKPLSRAQRRYLTVIAGYIANHGWAPTVREVADGARVSVNAAHEAINRLVSLGYLERGPGARALRVVPRER